MAFCINCGQKLEEDAKFCPGCGKAVSPAAGEPQSNANPYHQKSVEENLRDGFQQWNNTSDFTKECDAFDIKNNKAAAICSYLGILVLVPILSAKNSKFARFHANQGLVLLLFSIAYNIVTGVIKNVLRWSIFPLYSIAKALFPLISLVFVVLMIIGIINAANGKAKELPIIGKITLLK